ncbi:MAG: aminoacyl-tRNA deacylase [Gaiellaceae bacterium]
MDTWPEPVERVAAALRAAAIDARVEEFAAGTPTAVAAAKAVGCELAQIVKSLVFVCDFLPVLALLPGDRRADADKVSKAAGARYARMARPEEAVAATGFEPGAVSPVPPPRGGRVLIEETLLLHELVWIGAGSPHHLAGLAPRDLARAAGAIAADLAAEA